MMCQSHCLGRGPRSTMGPAGQPSCCRMSHLLVPKGLIKGQGSEACRPWFIFWEVPRPLLCQGRWTCESSQASQLSLCHPPAL